MAYRSYLSGERGLAEGTVTSHLRVAEVFLDELGEPLAGALQDLSAGEVLRIVGGLLARRAVASPRNMTVSVRVLLRFLFAGEWTGRHLAGVVLPAARWRLAGLPARLDAAAVTALLNGCDRASFPGRRDYAIIVVLARLGLRAGEAAALMLDDVGWRTGTIMIRGKGGRRDELPLPWDAGEAVAEYLRTRPPPGCGPRALFVTLLAPPRALTRQGIASLVRRACARAGIAPAGPHRLRHALASDLLAAGASLGEIGQLLRHQDPSTTAIYAKADRKALAVLARPWPIDDPGAMS